MRILQLFAYLWGLTLKKHRRIMKKMTLIFAAIGLLLCACEKENNSANADELVGEWENTLADFGQTMKFEKNGTISNMVTPEAMRLSRTILSTIPTNATH